MTDWIYALLVVAVMFLSATYRTPAEDGESHREERGS